jgi:tetratricopeptide (TPR) repeat protein
MASTGARDILAKWLMTRLVHPLLLWSVCHLGIRLRLCGLVAIVSKLPMFLRAVTVCSMLALSAPGVLASDRSAAKEQVDFGIKVAQNGLWREAQYRWERAVELDPTYAEAWNNLAIAYEHSGKFDDARKAYETAIKLDPKNMLIRQNYDLFKEINDRTQKRRGGR